MTAADRYVPEDLRVRTDPYAAIMPESPEADPDRIPTYGELIMERPPLGPRLADVSLDLLALTADYPVDSPLRQAVAHYVSRLALQEGKLATVTNVLETAERSGVGVLRVDQLLELLRR